MAHEIQADYASGNLLYAVIRSPAGQVWHPGEQVFEDWGTSGHTVDDYDITLTDRSGSQYTGSFDGDIPSGRYCIQIFRQVGANPADIDPFVCGREIIWTGAGELTPAKILANKAAQDKFTGAVEYYDDDGQTVLLTIVPRDEETIIARVPE